MNLYEHTIIARQDTSPSEIKQLTEKYSKIVEKNDGEIIKTELDGAFNFSQQFIKSSKNKKKRNIVFLSSIYSIVTHDHRIYENTNIATILTKTKKNKKKLFSHAAYPVAKSGIVALTKYLAAYCGKKSIRVNSISPGGVEQKGIDRKFVKNYSDKVPMNRRAKLREITNVVNFLQKLNIPIKSVALEVSKLLTSIEVKFKHPRNILPMLITLLVSKLLTSSEVILTRSRNI